MDDLKIPFPQADDFEKIIAILNIANESDLCDDNTLSIALGCVSKRQVDYYLSASAFLGFVDMKKRHFTDFGNNIRKVDSYMQIIECIAAVLKVPIFGKVFALETVVGHQAVEDIASIIQEAYPTYSEALCARRAQTVLSWVRWIKEKMKTSTLRAVYL